MDNLKKLIEEYHQTKTQIAIFEKGGKLEKLGNHSQHMFYKHQKKIILDNILYTAINQYQSLEELEKDKETSQILAENYLLFKSLSSSQTT